MIYFAQLPTGAIKIGYSANVPNRMQQLAAHYGSEPAVLYVMEGDKAVEREMHDRFAAHRFGKTEQFRPDPELLEFIGRPLLVTAAPGAVEVLKPLASLAKLPADVADSARLVAALKNEPVSDVLAGILRPALAKMEREELAKRAKRTGADG